jgi:acyl-CoA thioesterase
MTNEMPNAFFTRVGDNFLPTAHAVGPWNPNSLHGRVVAGLLGRTLWLKHGDDAFHPTRLTVDMFRLPAMSPLQVRTESVREGNRIRVAEGIVMQGGAEVARGSIVLLRRTEDPNDDTWRPPSWDVPGPEEIGQAGPAPFANIWETRPINYTQGVSEQRRTWLRETRLLVEGEPLTPFVRCAVAADFTSPLANMGTNGLSFVNADITLYLHRLPGTEWLGFEVASHQSADGIAISETTLYDESGPIGKSLVCAVANRRMET